MPSDIPTRPKAGATTAGSQTGTKADVDPQATAEAGVKAAVKVEVKSAHSCENTDEIEPEEPFAVGSLVHHPQFGVGKIEAKQPKGEHFKLKVGFHGTPKPYQIIHSSYVRPIRDRYTAQRLLMKGLIEDWAPKEPSDRADQSGPDPATFPIGSRVLHRRFGVGVVEYRRPVGEQWGLYIYFEKQGKGNLAVLSDYVIPLEEADEEALAEAGVKLHKEGGMARAVLGQESEWSPAARSAGSGEGPDPASFPVGTYVVHERFGPGLVEGRTPLGRHWKLNIFFEKPAVGAQYVLSSFVRPVGALHGPGSGEAAGQDWRPPEGFGVSDDEPSR